MVLVEDVEANAEIDAVAERRTRVDVVVAGLEDLECQVPDLLRAPLQVGEGLDVIAGGTGSLCC